MNISESKDFLVSSASLKEVRTFSREIFEKININEDLKDELVLAIAEAAQNIVKHAYKNINSTTDKMEIKISLKDSELEEEIKTSVCLLDKKAGIKSSHYAYPEGLDYSYSDEVIKVLKNHGVVCCPTAEYGINQINCDLFRLKRIMVDLESDYLCVE